MPLDCVKKQVSDGLPSKIVDLSTLDISVNNAGEAILSVAILAEDGDKINGTCGLTLNNVTFNGFIDNISPQPALSSTKYIEYRITAVGILIKNGGR